jgi:hypothetical protein
MANGVTSEGVPWRPALGNSAVQAIQHPTKYEQSSIHTRFSHEFDEESMILFLHRVFLKPKDRETTPVMNVKSLPKERNDLQGLMHAGKTSDSCRRNDFQPGTRCVLLCTSDIESTAINH